MTSEQKKLLFIDICARLPYGVMIKDTYYGHYGRLMEIGCKFAYFVSKLNSNTLNAQLCHVKPYLRPMSSMTEEEATEMFNRMYDVLDISLIKCEIEKDRIRYLVNGNNGAHFIVIFNDRISSLPQLEFLLEHHFDYRGLIEKGLALEALEGMYKVK